MENDRCSGVFVFIYNQPFWGFLLQNVYYISRQKSSQVTTVTYVPWEKGTRQYVIDAMGRTSGVTGVWNQVSTHSNHVSILRHSGVYPVLFLNPEEIREGSKPGRSAEA